MIAYYDNENSLVDIVENIDSLEILRNGQVKAENKTSKDFTKIKNRLIDLFQMARLMPAFGVSLHIETIEALKSGSWLQINFNKEISKNGLLFNSILIKLEKTSGFNLIRLYNGNYEERCLFVDLDSEVDLEMLIE